MSQPQHNDPPIWPPFLLIPLTCVSVACLGLAGPNPDAPWKVAASVVGLVGMLVVFAFLFVAFSPRSRP